MAVEFGAAFFGAAIPSIGKLLKYELDLTKTVKDGVASLQAELKDMLTFLQDVSSLPPEQLKPHVKNQAWEVRELRHDIDTKLHSFMVRMEATKDAPVPSASKRFINHQMAIYIEDTRIKIKDLRERHGGQYPRKHDMQISQEEKSSRQIAREIQRMDDRDNRESNPVGLDGAIDEIAKKLSMADLVSIAGMGGMGKTTLAGAVYDKMKEERTFDCKAFVYIGQRPDMLKILKDISNQVQTDQMKKDHVVSNEGQMVKEYNEMKKFLEDKRCLFVLDDIWDEETWNLVEPVFKGSAGSKIITTTRNLKIAEGIGGTVYTIKPLSFEDSRKLLHAKAQPNSHDDQIMSDKFLRKCGGVPLAITVIGSLLAKNPSKGWREVYDSIKFDDKGGVFEDVNTVLSSSYLDLPLKIKDCLLYLSLFPEGHWIKKNMLIWMWVADGLVDGGSFETGETYLKELLDRSMIQWAVSPGDVGQGGCRVHSLMLDLIRDLSSSENFSTVLDMKQESTSQTGLIHRLAIHQKINQTSSLEVGQAWSFFASTCPGSSMPPLSNFAHMRAIDLEHCDLSGGDCQLKHLGELEELKYVGLVGTPVADLPAGKGYFKVLETLDVTATGMKVLPLFVEDLRKLRCLRASKGTTMMGQVGKLTSLEELWLYSADKSPDFAVGLRKLTKLRVLVIHFDEVDVSMQKKLVESLGHLNKLQVLQIWFDTMGKVRLDGWEENVPYPELRQLLLFGAILSKQTPWIHHLCAPKLSKLLLQVETLTAEHLEMLGKMRSLRSLYVHSEEDKYRLSYTVNKNEFQVLEYLNTNIELLCGDGALPRIQELEVGGIRVGTDVGLRGNMPLLERATYHLDCKGCSPVEVHKAEEELRQASQAHPNHPALSIKRWNNAGSEIYHMVETLTPEVVRALHSFTGDFPAGLGGGGEGGADATSGVFSLMSMLLGDPAFVNALSEAAARVGTAIGEPPTLAVGDATDSTSYPSQGLSRNSEGETEFSADSLLAYLSSSQGAADLASYTEQMGMDPAVTMNVMKKCTQNPEFIAPMNRMVQNADGTFPSGSDLSGMVQALMMPELFSLVDWRGRMTVVSRILPGVAASTQEWSGQSFEVDANSILAGVESMIANNEMSATDAAGVRNFEEKCAQNPEIVACMNSMVAGGSFSGSDLSRLAKLMVPELVRCMPGKGQGADADADADADANLAESSGAGASREPPPKMQVDTNSVLSWLNTPDGAAFLSKEAAVLQMGPVAFARIFEKCLRNPEMIASMSSAARNGDLSDVPSLLENNTVKTVMNKLMFPEIIDYFGEQYGPASTPRFAGVAQGMGAPPSPESSGQNGENFSMMPAVQQALAAGASSGQSSSKGGCDAESFEIDAKGVSVDARKHHEEYTASTAGACREPPPSKADADRMLSWLNSPDGAALLTEGAAQSGTDHVACTRMLEKSMLNPEIIASVNSMMQNMDFSGIERHISPSSTPKYANGLGRADTASGMFSGLLGNPAFSSIMANVAAQPAGLMDALASCASVVQGMGAPPPPESSAQDGENFSRMLKQVLPAVRQTLVAGGQPSSKVNADSVLSHGGPADANGTLSGLSSDPAFAAQSGRMDAVASSTASVAQSTQDGENSSTIFNLNELLATLEKDSTDGASSGQPSSAQLDDVDNEEGDEA